MLNCNSCGIDEAGRGALAGPVCAAAVQLGPNYPRDAAALLADSKQLSAHQRVARTMEIIKYAARWAVSWATAEEVDEHNVLRATLVAMHRTYLLLCGIYDTSYFQPFSLINVVGGWAYEQKSMLGTPSVSPSPTIAHSLTEHAPPLGVPLPQCVIIDGPHVPPQIKAAEVHGVVKADETVESVQAASILAKVHRDAWMTKRAHFRFPQYGFDQHKGYPTKFHRKMIADYGASSIHRCSFNGVRGYSIVARAFC